MNSGEGVQLIFEKEHLHTAPVVLTVVDLAVPWSIPVAPPPDMSLVNLQQAVDPDGSDDPFPPSSVKQNEAMSEITPRLFGSRQRLRG
jgi:hypothetical protein